MSGLTVQSSKSPSTLGLMSRVFALDPGDRGSIPV